MRGRFRWYVLALLVTSVASCGRDSPEAVITREVKGDTTFVVVSTDTAATHQARVDLVVGEGSTADEYTFGHIEALHVDDGGRILVSDPMLTRVVRYTSDGRYLDRVASGGDGPGELDHLWGMTTDRQGRILLAEYDGRVHVLNDAAEYLDMWRAPRRTYSSSPVAANIDGTFTVATVGYVGPDGQWGVMLYTLDDSGTVIDSLPRPWAAPGGSGSGDGNPRLAWSPAGFGVTTLSSRVGFDVFRPGRTAVTRVRQDVADVPYADEERREWAEYRRFLIERSGNPEAHPPPPALKQPLARTVISRTGEVWLVRNRPARRNPNAAEFIMGYPAPPDWIAPFRAEVYTPAGDHLASVAGPIDFTLHFASSDSLWGVTRTGLGELRPVRLLLDRTITAR